LVQVEKLGYLYEVQILTTSYNLYKQMNSRQQAILYLTYLLVYSDGEFDDSERIAIKYICREEGIGDDDYQNFLIDIQDISERELYDRGVDMIELCSEDDSMAVFVWLYKLSEADGTVHAKEVRFLLYSLRRANIDFDAVKQAASSLPSIPVA
jgi:uncharacterized tellurite resistance protein B-like protein